MAAYLTFNGTELPCPSSLSYEGQQLVDSARNALGEVVAQKINRRMVKLSGITWNVLYPEDVKKILDCIEQFSGTLKYYDPKTGSFINREMYWGDYSVKPYWSDKETGKPTMFVQMNASLIDMGLPD